jgi:tRNA dimethylallyltransferase
MQNVLQEVLRELDKPQHEGGCGNSGRLDKATAAALKRYVPTLKLYSDEGRVNETLAWVAAAAAAPGRRQQQPQQQQQQQQQQAAGPESGCESS